MYNDIYIFNKFFDNNLNEYIFNNSLIEYDNHYIMVYRHIIYTTESKIHPWSAWCKSYDVTQKSIIEKNKELNVNIKLFNLDKYRESLDIDYFINMISNDCLLESENIDKTIDTTGLCIFTKNNDLNKIQMIYNNPKFFNNYNQDSRIYNIDNELYITYNGFFKTESNDLRVKLLYRKIIINFSLDNIYIGEELPLINKKFNIERKVEKNCILDMNKNVLYDINGIFKFIHKDKGLICRNIPNLLDIINFYGKTNIFFSLGTPIQTITVKNRKLFISLGHVKINYKNINKNTKFHNFLKNIDYSKIKMHGKYVYLMFFYTFDNCYNIIHFSYSFIPTNNNNSHLPYLLVFPCGLYKINNKYIISYGEGDEYAKAIILEEQTIINKLLIPVEKINKDNYDFQFFNINTNNLIPNEKVYNYLIYGYYSKFNCGDDAFKIVFKEYFKNNNKNNHKIDFYNPSNINNLFSYFYDEIIIGGGDIVNSYFINPLLKFNITNIPIKAISIGIPYLDNIHYLNYFDKSYSLLGII